MMNTPIFYGDFVYDDLKYLHGKLIFWEQHYLRLMATMRIMRMQIPLQFTMEELESQILTEIRKNQLHDKTAFVKLLITRNPNRSQLPNTNEIQHYIIVEQAKQDFYTITDTPYEVDLFRDYHINPNLLATLKTNNKATHITAHIYAQENDYQNAILINTNKNVVSFTDGNLFLVENTHIKTPPLSDGCVNGITRKRILEILSKSTDFTIEETSISPFDLQRADEVFLTNTFSGIQPVTKYKKKDFQSQVATHLIGKLNTMVRLG